MKYEVPLDANALTNLIHDLQEGAITPQEYEAIIDKDKKASMVKPKDMNSDDLIEINRLLNRVLDILNKSRDDIVYPKWDNHYPMDDYETKYQDMYKEYMSKGYTVNADNTVKMVDHFYRIAYDANAFYPTVEFANKASQMKKFNDATLLFKWMYDRDFEPDWGTWSGARHYVIYNDATQEFEANRSATHANLIYFSSAKIAKACATWLNRVFKKGLL